MASILCFFICWLITSALIAGAITTSSTTETISITAIPSVTNNTNTASPHAYNTTPNSTITTLTSSTITSTNSTSTSLVSSTPLPSTASITSLSSGSTTSTPTTTPTTTSTTTSTTTPTTATTTATTSSTTQVPSTTHAATHSTSLSLSTSSGAVTPTKPPTNLENVTVSETNLLLASDKFFIELSGPANISLHGLTLAVYDTEAESSVWNITFSANDSLNDKGLHVVQNINGAADMQGAVAVVLFESSGFRNNFTESEKSIVSHLMFSSNSSSVYPAYREILLRNQNKFLTVVNKTKLQVSSVSMSHCGDNLYPILTTSSPGMENICSFPENLRTVYTLMLKKKKEVKIDCSKIATGFSYQLMSNISEKCQCSVNPGLFLDSIVTCNDNLVVRFTFRAMVPRQLESFNESYHDYVTQNKDTLVNEIPFELMICADTCNPPHEPTGKNNDTSVTAAVVLSCIAVFSVILIAVIVYMRRKRRSTLQFRMSRLNEDDDMIGDMDDFIGSSDNNEPSFTNSQYNLTR
ncbi:putative GPI-anchored protein pfl2 isoform X2 [Pomacea canaliculata]|uniref:putative GPI-anchored protein pfl2 isoform X2 n=1 Tax=Pomacea canaliculata TaxID=400727 RepID=UPI000D72E5CF|nr:putative GPI-anchored protein pfl2 isoform X2 [Pomacea canaliculata]